jgi:hypothetical protein
MPGRSMRCARRRSRARRLGGRGRGRQDSQGRSASARARGYRAALPRRTSAATLASRCGRGSTSPAVWIGNAREARGRRAGRREGPSPQGSGRDRLAHPTSRSPAGRRGLSNREIEGALVTVKTVEWLGAASSRNSGSSPPRGAAMLASPLKPGRAPARTHQSPAPRGRARGRSTWTFGKELLTGGRLRCNMAVVARVGCAPTPGRPRDRRRAPTSIPVQKSATLAKRFTDNDRFGTPRADRSVLVAGDSQRGSAAWCRDDLPPYLRSESAGAWERAAE